MAVARFHGVRPLALALGMALFSIACSSAKSPSTTPDGGQGGVASTGGSAAGGSHTTSKASGGQTSGATADASSTGGSSGTGGAGGRGQEKDARAEDGATDSNAGGAGGGAGADARKDAVADNAAANDGPADAPAGSSDVPPAKRDTAADERALDDGAGDVVVPAGYRLVWSDEFDVDGSPDPKNWNYEKGFVRNNELQWYQADNAKVQGGMLIIEGRNERVSNPNYRAGSSDWKTSRQYADYTSTSMTTSGLQTWQYGRFEMRGRIPTAPGMWPAWWTLGVSGEWPSNGEIDIMEYYNGKVLANVACGTDKQWTAKWDSVTKSLSSLGAGWSDRFHVWRMDWDDQKIDLYLDDTLMNSATLASMLNADGTSPFKQKVYMLLNLAIGGDNGGNPSDTTFPVRFEVDYVRVFQRL